MGFVIEKTASGWWLAAPAGRMESIIPGYVEASYLDTEENKVTPESVKCEEKFIVIENYAAMNDDELTVIKGESVTVTVKFLVRLVERRKRRQFPLLHWLKKVPHIMNYVATLVLSLPPNQHPDHLLMKKKCQLRLP